VDVVIAIGEVIIGFILLLKGADFFVDGAAALAARLGIPQIVIGLTVVAFGTSAPEAAVSISAGIKGNNGISIGNVVGSNIFNILIILGVTAVITTLSVRKETVKVDIPVMIGATILMVVWGMLGKTLTKITGVIFLLILFSYIGYLVYYSKKNGADDGEDIKELKGWMIPVFILGGLAAIIFGSNITVTGSSTLASMMGVSDRVIGLTIVALGTSLPELMTSLTAAKKGNADIAIGNIVGSNIFNILFILGITTLLIDLPYVSDTADFTIDGIVALISAVVLWVITFKTGKLKRRDGILMLAMYLVYFIYLAVGK